MNKSRVFLHSILIVGCLSAFAHADDLLWGFQHPPDQTRPWCYWYWISNNISKEGITRDLEAMARVGIGEALIGNIFLDDTPAGDIEVLSDRWWALTVHAIREGRRVGVNIGLFNCPGWSQSGGPWIGLERSMRYLVSSETRVHGPGPVRQVLPVAAEPFQDVAVLAFPVPEREGASETDAPPLVTCTPPAENPEALVDGDLVMEVPLDLAEGSFQIDLAYPSPHTARHLSMVPGDRAWAASCRLEAADADGTFREVTSFSFNRLNRNANVGPMTNGAVAVSFSAVTSSSFRLVCRSVQDNPGLVELELSGAARLDRFVEKQLGKMFPAPLPLWDAYTWGPSAEPGQPGWSVAPETVVNLSKHLDPDGLLTWTAPAGDWVVQRVGMTPTGTRNAPASPVVRGLEVDKMNRDHARYHFEAFVGQVLKRLTADERRAFTRVVADSYEMGSQNWTDGLETVFRETYGYDPMPWLPVLQGRLVGSADQSDRFLWDLRRLVADRIATEYVGGLNEVSREQGLGLWLENYGHWGFPGEFLMYGSRSDRIGGEYWVTGSLGSIECRAASSCANTYGMPFVSAESFTGGPPFRNAPADLKARGDWSFCEGINHFVLHVYIQQPWEDRKPGVNAWFGTEFNRHNTWFEQSKDWIDYLRHCCWMLQQGHRVADVAYFIGEDTPKMTGIREPALPRGYDFDYINAEVIERDLEVQNGRLTLPHGTEYRVLVLPPQSTMRPAVLRKIADLVRDGATVLGPLPEQSPSLEGYPDADAEIRDLADTLRRGPHPVLANDDLGELLADRAGGPDVVCPDSMLYTHRRTSEADIYFVSNQDKQPVTPVVAFRAGNRAPELWDPVTGDVTHPAVYAVEEGYIRMPLALGPHGSMFVVFRKAAEQAGITRVLRNGNTILDTALRLESASGAGPAATPGTFGFAAWVWPEADTTLLEETNRGIRGMSDARNDFIFPPHGERFGGDGHAGAGLAVGRNGVCVFEHGAGYFAPVLVCKRPIEGWTHLAVVYENNRPRLFVNGRLAATGLPSTHVVHAGPMSDAGTSFRGRYGPVRLLPGPLDDSSADVLMRAMARPDRLAHGVGVDLTRDPDGRLNATAAQPGAYTLESPGGPAHSFEVGSLPPPVDIGGNWSLHVPGRKDPVVGPLGDWSRSEDDAIKYFSGRMVYVREFDGPALQADLRWFLELGRVYDLATVRLNGKDMGTLWDVPWRMEVTESLVAGRNRLEIDVVNAWNNRLVGDAARPEAERKSFLLSPTVKKDAPLQPAGLIGPVSLQPAAQIRVNETVRILQE